MRITLFAFLTILLIGCGEKTITNTGTAVGDIVGKVALSGTYKNPISDHSGVTVALENTSYSTTTDSKGFWTLHNVPAGSYTISFSKDSFATMKDFNLSFNGNGTSYYQFNLPNTPPGWYPTLLYLITEGAPTLSIAAFQGQWVYKDTAYQDSLGWHNGRYDSIPNYSAKYKASFGLSYAETQARGVIVFFGKDNSISPTDPLSYSYVLTPYSVQQDSNGYYIAIGVIKSALYSAGFSPSQKIFCVAYGGSSASVFGARYFDPTYKQMVYTGVGKGHSEIKSFICP